MAIVERCLSFMVVLVLMVVPLLVVVMRASRLLSVLAGGVVERRLRLGGQVERLGLLGQSKARAVTGRATEYK